MKWIKAGVYVRLTEENKETAHRVGMYPINDVLLPFMGDDNKIILLRGGRGGGKSNTIALRLVQECADSEYFKCYFGRKVLDRVRGSQHQELVKAIKQLRLEHEFDFSEKSNGSLTITHIRTGNSFIAFGGDNPQSMKSISDPTHVWCDEFDQFTELDFRALFPTLRTIRGKNIFIGSFNSYEVIKTHWLVKFFYPEIYAGTDKYDYDALQGVSISKYLVNYTDNFFIDQLEYEKQLKVAAGGDMDLFDGLAKGEWGLDKKGNEYYHAFKTGVHIGAVPFIPQLPIHLSYDFNLLPYMTLICCQIVDTYDTFQIRVFKEYCLKPPLNTTEDVTAEFMGDFFYRIQDLFYYGDAMGTRGVEGFGSNFTRFDPVREILSKFLTASSDRTTRRNLGVLKRRDLLNKILSGNLFFGNKQVSIVFDSSCVEMTNDMQYLKLGIDGKLKEKVKDPVTGATWEKLGHCFSGETLVETINGCVRIDQIKKDDLVLTRNGYKRVLNVFDNGIKKVKKFNFDNTTLICTPDHKIYTNGLFTPANYIKVGDVLLTINKTPCNRKLSYTIHTASKDIQIQKSFQTGDTTKGGAGLITCGKRNTSTGICGSLITETYPVDTTSTTRTETTTIIPCQTLNSKPLIRTCQNITQCKVKNLRLKKRLIYLQKRSLLQRSGINQKKAGDGTANMLKQLLKPNQSIGFVQNVDRDSRKNIPPMCDIVLTPARLNTVIIEDLPARRVYDIQVEENHEYFANGVLVHNCSDALEYFICYILDQFL